MSPSTVTTTVKRLADRGLVEHVLYKGVDLTAAGRREAISAIRRHRIVERFLSDMLGYAWNEADRLATSFEHEIPQEVEDLLARHPAVAEAAAIGVPDPKFGQRLRAFVALAPGASVDEDELKSYVKENLAGYKVPREILFRPELPHNVTGKVVKRLLE